jgi:hypothetical protein
MDKLLVSPFLQGGLGNYMFQIAAAYSVSVRDKKDMVVDISDIAIVHSPIETYFTNIFRNIKFVNEFKDYYLHNPSQPIEYSEIPNIPQNLRLMGYYQNEKYFNNIRKEILDLFSIDSDTLNFLNQKYSEIINGETCSIHVRRGNYVQKSDYHPLQSTEYYKKAISIIGEDLMYVIFSDDINWCRENLNFIKNKTFIVGNVDYQELYLMSMCNNNIIANSSFSWWGAWLNNNKNKKVIYPSNWFGVPFLDASDIGGENWIKI